MTAITAERTCEVTRLHYFDNPGDARPRKFYDIYLVTHDDSTASVLINYGAGASPRVTGGRQTYTSGRLQVKHQGRLAAMVKMRDKLMAAKEGRGYQFRNREQGRVCDPRFRPSTSPT